MPPRGGRRGPADCSPRQQDLSITPAVRSRTGVDAHPVMSAPSASLIRRPSIASSVASAWLPEPTERGPRATIGTLLAGQFSAGDRRLWHCRWDGSAPGRPALSERCAEAVSASMMTNTIVSIDVPPRLSRKIWRGLVGERHRRDGGQCQRHRPAQRQGMHARADTTASCSASTSASTRADHRCRAVWTNR